jgi:hypothetical protein
VRRVRWVSSTFPHRSDLDTDLLYLHRSFFARAVSDHPKDPLGSPYGTSVIAAYRSAGSLIQLMRNLHTQLKEPSERIWFLWTHMFSCAVSYCSSKSRTCFIHITTSDCPRLNCDAMSIDELCAVRPRSVGVRLRIIFQSCSWIPSSESLSTLQ